MGVWWSGILRRVAPEISVPCFVTFPVRRQPCVYILASKPGGVLYTGVTSNLASRVRVHRLRLVDGFTKAYNVHRLVWFEVHSTMHAAIQREKQIKKWNRLWKIQMIERINPTWGDLTETLG